MANASQGHKPSSPQDGNYLHLYQTKLYRLTPAPSERRTAKSKESSRRGSPSTAPKTPSISPPVAKIQVVFLQHASSPLLLLRPAQISAPPRQFATLFRPFLFQKPSVQAEPIVNLAPPVASPLHSWFHAHEAGTWGPHNLS